MARKSLKSKIRDGDIDQKTATILLAEQKLSQMERRGVDPMVIQAEKIKIAVQIKKSMLPHLYERPWYQWAWDFFNCRNRFALLTAANQVSKAEAYGNEIPTDKGFKRIEDIQVGDIVFSSDGSPTKVVGIPYDGVDECYRITFDDGAEIAVSRDHRWVCGGFMGADTIGVHSTEEMFLLKFARDAFAGSGSLYIPICQKFEKEGGRRKKRVVTKIEPLGPMRCRCISVEHPSGTYLTTRNHIVTHNSSTAIRTIIEWAGNPSLWKELWPDDPNPKIFFYCYPSSDVATTEFEKKWIPEFLPRDEMKTHKTYGWHAEYDKNKISSVTFNSGVTIYFKTYMQQEINLQTSTVHAVFLDEEIPLDGGMFDELVARLRGTRGYLRMVFTATIGQDLFYRAMERVGMPDEAFPGAWKRCVSLYDSMHYRDGTPSKWTAERIAEEEATCTTENERLKRIMGRFVKDDGVDFPTFSQASHVIEPFDIPASWYRYAAVDVGGNQSKQASKAAVLFLAVNEDMTKAYVYDCWRGDATGTTSGDVLNRYLAMRGSSHITQKAYDYGSAEFYEISVRRGETFLPAKKERGVGIKRVNELFKCGSLYIMKKGDWSKLTGELLTASTQGRERNKKKDDLCDTLRYAAMLVPFDWSKISPDHKDGGHFYLDGLKQHATKEKSQRQKAADLAMGRGDASGSWEAELNAELDAWNEAYGS